MTPNKQLRVILPYVLARCVLGSAISILVAMSPICFAQVSTVISITQKAKLQSEPGRFGITLLELQSGEKVELMRYRSGDKWALVRTSDAKQGWVLSSKTSLQGRRSDPVVKDDPDSVYEDEEGIDLDRFSFLSKNIVSFDAFYLNQLSYGTTHGWGLGAEYHRFFAQEWFFGLRASFSLAAEDIIDSNLGDVWERRESIWALNPLIGWQQGAFRVSLGLGWEGSNQNATSRNAAGAEVTSDVIDCDGYREGWNHSLTMRAQPSFLFPLSEHSFLAIRGGAVLTIKTQPFQRCGFADESTLMPSVEIGVSQSFVF